MSVAEARAQGKVAADGRVIRHRLPDRLFHWVMAASVLVLLATGFLPVLGIKFAWVTIHWIAGLVLTGAIMFHIVRVAGWLEFRSMWIGLRDLRRATRSARHVLGGSGPVAGKPGKYQLGQKLYHLAIAVIVLAAVATGLVMMAKVDTPLWQRDPYLLESGTWGIIYVLHGYAGMSLITLLIVHVYFAFRPEKLWFTRSMVLGWITEREYRAEFDSEQWKARRYGR
ncbi:MAG TPA: cytochrome b/b6 domain-containing protein [Alphaproteobacteria bacterium]|nr:cytochrome b/b6 domain-containing protein [Alphaproteobacteria bacterium]